MREMRLIHHNTVRHCREREGKTVADLRACALGVERDERNSVSENGAEKQKVSAMGC